MSTFKGEWGDSRHHQQVATKYFEHCKEWLTWYTFTYECICIQIFSVWFMSKMERRTYRRQQRWSCKSIANFPWPSCKLFATEAFIVCCAACVSVWFCKREVSWCETSIYILYRCVCVCVRQMASERQF